MPGYLNSLNKNTIYINPVGNENNSDCKNVYLTPIGFTESIRVTRNFLNRITFTIKMFRCDKCVLLYTDVYLHNV